jgi:hypothetical protein
VRSEGNHWKMVVGTKRWGGWEQKTQVIGLRDACERWHVGDRES